MWPFKKRDDYVRASGEGTVTRVQTGLVVAGGVTYSDLRCTLVQPGQRVKQGQPLGRRK